jgi:hypothetical protein
VVNYVRWYLNFSIFDVYFDLSLGNMPICGSVEGILLIYVFCFGFLLFGILIDFAGIFELKDVVF